MRPLLESLVQRGLLRSFGSGSQSSYECHDLVRRFVHEQIEARDGTEAWRTLEAETAAALTARGEPERALRHAIASGLSDHVAALVRELAPALLREDGRCLVLPEWTTWKLCSCTWGEGGKEGQSSDVRRMCVPGKLLNEFCLVS